MGGYPSGASPYGVLDMCGNVFEWVDSPFSSFEGFEAFKLDKGKRSKIVAPDFDRSLRVAKGGSFATARNDMRIDVRMGLHPGENDASLGFRAARSAEAGVDIISHAYLRLLPPSVQGLQQLDLSDVVAKEITSYGHDNQVISGHRYLAFAHPAPAKGPGLSAMRKDARDEQVTLGILFHSEPLEQPPLPRATTSSRTRPRARARPTRTSVAKRSAPAATRRRRKRRSRPRLLRRATTAAPRSARPHPGPA